MSQADLARLIEAAASARGTKSKAVVEVTFKDVTPRGGAMVKRLVAPANLSLSATLDTGDDGAAIRRLTCRQFLGSRQRRCGLRDS